MVLQRLHEGLTGRAPAWRGRWESCACYFLWLVVAIPELGAQADAPAQSRYQKTVAYLQGAAPHLRQDFAAIALAELAEAYHLEARLAREQAREAENGATLRSWSIAVDGYARQMPLLLEDIEFGFPVDITPGAGGTPAVSVADRVVILNHPRPSQQQRFEHAILKTFCASHRCELFAAPDAPEPIEIYTGSVRPTWSFTQRGPSCSYEGLVVQFSSALDLSSSRVICDQLMREVDVLADEFAWQQRHAVAIDWSNLEIRRTQGGPDHMVRLNSVGDVLLVSIPLLYSTPGLLLQVSPWIRARLDNGQGTDIVLQAREFGWQDP